MVHVYKAFILFLFLSTPYSELCSVDHFLPFDPPSENHLLVFPFRAYSLYKHTPDDVVYRLL